MTYEFGSERLNLAQHETAYLSRRVCEEAEAAAHADSLSATLIHVALATAYADRCRKAYDRDWVAKHRVW